MSSSSRDSGSASTNLPVSDTTAAEELGRLWRAGEPPDVDAFLRQVGPLPLAQLAAVVRADQRQRWQAGDTIAVETYLQRYPELQDHASEVLDLIYHEFLLQERSGVVPCLDEYLERFPEHAAALRVQVEFHLALDEADSQPDRSHAETPPAGENDGPAGPAAPLAGLAVPGYAVLGILGHGGMGRVYKARDLRLGRLVALKVLRVDQARPELFDRFRREAEAVARLQHPNIVQVFEVGEASDQPILALELVEGCTLQQRLAGAPQEARWSAHLIEAVARATQHAHERGIVHRDLKPANVMLATDGTPKITDFGLAKHLEAEAENTQTGTILGTPSYMAPEQAGGHARDIGPAVDIYALGALLYECLTGRPPFQAATMLETVELVRSREPMPPGRLQPNLPRDLETICLKCLEKDPHKRYISAQDLAEDLRRFLAHEPILARRIGPLGRAGRWCRRKPAVAALLSCAAVLLVATVTVSTLSAWRLDAAARRAERAERDATERLFNSTVTRARALRKSGEIGQRFASLAALKEAVAIARSLGVLDAHALALRNEAIASLALADLRKTHEWDIPVHWPGDQACPTTFDVRLERYACAGQDGAIHVFETAGRREIARLSAPGARIRYVDMHLSADGRFLAAVYWFADASSAQFNLWELGGSGPVRRLGPEERVGFYAFSPDGRRLGVSQPDGSIHLHDLVSGQRQTLGPNYQAAIMTFRPDGRQLAFTSHAALHQIQILDVDANQILRRLSCPDDIRTLAWNATGRLLAAGCDDCNVHVWDAGQLQEQALLQGHQKPVSGLAFSPTEDLLASSAQDGTTRLWDPVSGRPLLTAPGQLLQFGSDGQRLAFQHGQRVGFWEVADGRECAVLHHGRVGNRTPWLNSRGPEMLDISTDGRLLASAAADGVRLWDVLGRREIAFLNIGHHEAALFHPDGTRLYTFGRTGLRCWPIRQDDRGPGSLRIGPPRLFCRPAADGWFRGGRDRSGKLLTAAEHLDDRHDRLVLFPGLHAATRTVLADDLKLSRIAVSPDGRWIAAGQLEPVHGAKVWDAQTGRLAWSSPCGRDYVVFSPDSQWLLAGGSSDYGLWHVGSWEPAFVLARDAHYSAAGYPAFRPDGHMLALARSQQHIELVDLATRRELVTLQAPDQACIGNWLCFSPDGRLLAAATETHSIQLWDLAALARQLRALDLGAALLLEAPDDGPEHPPLRARVFQEVYEAEHLKVAEAASWATQAMDMKPWGRQHWSNGKVLHSCTPKGGFVEVLVDVPATARYRLAICFNYSWDSGLVETMLDGRKIGRPFDSFARSGQKTATIDYGTFELSEGPHRLRFTAVDKNPKSADYRIGVDYIRLTPLKPADQGPPADRKTPSAD